MVRRRVNTIIDLMQSFAIIFLGITNIINIQRMNRAGI